LFRRFSLTERFKMDFRTEAYNIFNHPQFANPNSNVSNLGFGEITSTLGFADNQATERRIRFALRLQF